MQEAAHDSVKGKAAGVRVCLAASGGGHLRQLIDLESAWSKHDCFFVTENTALGRSLADKWRMHFVAHFAVGQARLGSPLRMLRAAIYNMFQSLRIMFRERPDYLITTGAGAMFFTVLWARLFGARIILIESFARFAEPSLFARATAPLAHHKVIQSAALATFWSDAKIFDPLKILGTQRLPKQPLLFVTVGAILPFDRMVECVARLKEKGLIAERIVAQVGQGGTKPAGIECVETLTFEDIQRLLKDADIVVCHGGTGSLITALREGCRTVAMPRLLETGEGYDDHQLEITTAFRERGLIEVAQNEQELALALERARARSPVVATSDPSELKQFLDELIVARA